MARTLILVRHGKAEKAAAGQADQDRSLTPAGMAALERSLPRTLSLLEDADANADEPAAPFLVWTSPAVRARQTCERVIAALDALHFATATPEEHESLWYQDPVTFLDELANTPADARIVAVGHIPFMEGMLERLTAAELAFAPGGVAAVELADDPHGKGAGRLLWFVQGPRVRK